MKTRQLIEEETAEVKVTRRRYLVEGDSEPPPSEIVVDGEESSGVYPALRPLAKATRLAEVVPLFRRMAG